MELVQLGIPQRPTTGHRETPTKPRRLSRLVMFAKDLVRFILVQKPVAGLFRTHFNTTPLADTNDLVGRFVSRV